ncbi:MAG: peptidase S41 [Rhodospirillaceae bacterium]|nr:peptidase S41 [Rhodospirillaceae bacterium]
MKHITKPLIAFAAFLLLASCEIFGPKPGPQAVAAANQIAADITLHRATAGLGTELSDPALAIFARVFEKVREDYVRAVTDTALLSAARAGLKKAHPDPKGVDDGVLVMAAIDGMLGSLDRYSTYLDPSDLKAMRDRIRGQFGGLGIKVRKHDEGLTVVAPIDGTPAYRAGLKSGDIISHADGKALKTLTLPAAVRILRGDVGEPITLTIRRSGAPTFDVEVVREVIKVAGVRSRVEKDVGYIRVSEFTRHVSRRVEDAVEIIRSKAGSNLKGFVLDLRNNPGGPFDEAIFMSDSFLEQGRIVSTKSRDGEAHHEAEAGDVANGLPVVVLINGGSASAAEIVAGALRDHKRAVLIGRKSFGKGTVQRLIPLGRNDALRLTTAIYLTPSGKSVEGGIEPDVDVVSDDDRDGDEQLERAIQTVRELYRSRP